MGSSALNDDRKVARHLAQGSYYFGLILFANMADNSIDPRRIIILLELVTGIVLLIEVGILIPDPNDEVTVVTELSCDCCQ